MKKIIGRIQPFEMTQNFYIYEDGNLINEISGDINEIPSIAYENDINKVDLYGSKQFNRGIREKIKKAEMTKYNKNILEVNVL